MAQAIRPDSLTPIDDAVSIAEQVSWFGFSASSTGVLVYGTGPVAFQPPIPGTVEGQLTWFDRGGHILGTVSDPGVYRIVALSPDNKLVAMESLDRQKGIPDINILEFARGTNKKFTFHPEGVLDPVWSPKGDRLVFATLARQWYQKASNMLGSEEPVFKPPQPATPQSWSPNGKFLLYNELRAPYRIWAVDVSAPAADRKPIPVVSSDGNSYNARFSPDGKWFSYVSTETGKNEIYVRLFNPSDTNSSAEVKWMVSKGGGGSGGAVWRADGKELFYIGPDHKMMSVEILPGSTFLPQTPRALFTVAPGIAYFAVTNDGERFLMPVPAAASVPTPPYKIVLNWTATLGKK
jgi:WD40 repeat protein